MHLLARMFQIVLVLIGEVVVFSILTVNVFKAAHIDGEKERVLKHFLHDDALKRLRLQDALKKFRL